MKKNILFSSLILAILQIPSLHASLQSELVQLTDALEELAIKLGETKEPRLTPPCPIPQMGRQQTTFAISSEQEAKNEIQNWIDTANKLSQQANPAEAAEKLLRKIITKNESEDLSEDFLEQLWLNAANIIASMDNILDVNAGLTVLFNYAFRLIEGNSSAFQFRQPLQPIYLPGPNPEFKKNGEIALQEWKDEQRRLKRKSLPPEKPLFQTAPTTIPVKPKPAEQPLTKTTTAVPVVPKGEPIISSIQSAAQKLQARRSLGAPLTPQDIQKGGQPSAIFSLKPLQPKSQESILKIFQLIPRGAGLQKDFVVKKEIQLPKPLTPGQDRFIATEVNKLSTAENKKVTAAEINTYINDRVKTKDSSNNQLQIFKALATILAIDPLLIQTSVDTLRRIRVPNEDIYLLITELYAGRIDYLTYQFALMKRQIEQNPNQKLSEGMRQDIDEGLTYPIEISGEVQNAEIQANKNDNAIARIFFNDINIQWERLLKLLQKELSRQQKKVLKNEGIDIKQYIKGIKQQKSRVYCKLKDSPTCPSYKSFYTELDELGETVDQYEKLKARNLRIHKAFAIQNIINKLKAFNIYSTDKQFCQVCLDQDTATSDKQNTENQFKKIKKFIKGLSAEKEDHRLIETLNIIKTAKADEQKRWNRVRLHGVGSTFE